MAGDFFDTNVLLYLASADPAKADIAENTIAGGGAVSVQVLNEFANVARRKMRLSWTDTHTFLSTLRSVLTVHSVTLEIHEAGLKLGERYSFSIYDAMIVASAIHSGCTTLWSEDMQHGLVLREGEEDLRIMNPFVAG
jgi:predicted nucleic acid-binding protein